MHCKISVSYFSSEIWRGCPVTYDNCVKIMHWMCTGTTKELGLVCDAKKSLAWCVIRCLCDLQAHLDHTEVLCRIIIRDLYRKNAVSSLPDLPTELSCSLPEPEAETTWLCIFPCQLLNLIYKKLLSSRQKRDPGIGHST